MRYALILSLVLPMLLAACATLDENACRTGDWQSIGQHDGAAGRTSDYVANHAKACGKYGISPNITAWEAGRQQGLPLYCTPRRAWEEGARGHSIRNVCPAADLANLERQNRRGLTWYRIGRDIDDSEREISRINHELAGLAPDDPSRPALYSERAALRLDIVTSHAEQLLYRYREEI